MRKVTALIIALVLFLGTAFGLHVYDKKALAFNNNAFSTWSSQTKFASPDGISENINPGTLVVFGSSEFQHGIKTIYHPRSMFKGFYFNPMLIGAAHYQSLSHAITLAAISNSIKNKKVVLFVSPTWFRKHGVKNKAFALRFSDSSYIQMLKNRNISKKTKEYIRNRVDTLLKVDKSTLNRVKVYNRVLLDGTGSTLDDIKYELYKKYLAERTHQRVVLRAAVAELKHNQNKNLKDRKINWRKYIKRVNVSSKKYSKTPFYMTPKGYAKLQAKLKRIKRPLPKAGFGNRKSLEYKDLRCFLNMCHQLKLKVMIVSLPVNGYWYDYRGFPAYKRGKYYRRLRAVASQYGAEMTDFSSKEYNKYFFEDALHLSGKGWVMADEALYKFYKES
ncbi:D-alanyl-lipoteichoic acid biosynthesis protein DltD [Clostridium oryzae]|uniref:D-alanyl-lipoteichoic acid biosynthesis protein DltD n=1 Tax=Clostridium oryzae TaxID=1450648 RepID=A0A1V4J0T4_9CLOT|nr:D-alanyl-lipoteichoic acid biosynthesis protein DltD [Clostridium oryzae]OPJ65257.1 hypothetical protein CLORY_02570 [Clostridium oryzae]